jgi:hypothetical protein
LGPASERADFEYWRIFFYNGLVWVLVYPRFRKSRPGAMKAIWEQSIAEQVGAGTPVYFAAGVLSSFIWRCRILSVKCVTWPWEGPLCSLVYKLDKNHTFITKIQLDLTLLLSRVACAVSPLQAMGHPRLYIQFLS